MYINYNTVSGIEYATATHSVRKGGSVGKGEQIYLGRVLDKKKAIFKSRERGVFSYDVESGSFSVVPAEYEEPKKARKTKNPKRPGMIVSFGDIFLLDSYIREIGMLQAIDATKYQNLDTLHALLAYYILSPHAHCHAQDWWELTYAKILYPKAQLSSQRISDALADIGSEDAKRGFFKEYFRFLDKAIPKMTGADSDWSADEPGEGILIDSSGLPNSSHMPLTAVNTHNGVTSNEIRLIYVVQQRTGLPLFFRYVAGNIVDVTTLTRTIAELKANGINTKFAILDAGYYTGHNADDLFDAKVSFITRMKGNFKTYKNIVEEHIGTLQSKENLVRYHGRLIYVKRVDCMIGSKEDRPAHAYLCLDLAMRHKLERKLAARAEDEDLPAGEVFDEMQAQGVFMVVSSRRIAKENLLALYYTRDQIEKVFELCKQHGKILPINVGKEETLRGHLMMTFMAVVLLKFMSDKLKGSVLTTESMFMNLHEQHATVYDEEIITTEPTKKMNDAYKIFRIKCPVTIPQKSN
jgi:hypothetical protein